MDHKYPETRTGAAIFLEHAATHLIEGHVEGHKAGYDDFKSSQVLDVLHDLLIAEARLEAWYVDLGFRGCQPEESSIGGVSCLMGGE